MASFYTSFMNIFFSVKQTNSHYTQLVVLTTRFAFALLRYFLGENRPS